MSDTRALFDRALGAYLGLAIGDALGATVEFMRPREIRAQYGVHREMMGGGWLKLARGQVTDDTQMCLALGDALLLAGAPLLAARDDSATRQIAEAFVRWLRSKPVDCGNTCRRGIQRYLSDGSLQGPANEGDAGKGALMRNLPVVLATLHNESLLAHWSLAQARITHHHPLSDAATLGLARLTRAALLGADTALLAHQAQDWIQAWPAFRHQPYPGRASAYVVDTVQTVLHFGFTHPDFEQALVATVNQGDDADTTGALVGMLAGARCGASRLPRRWLQRLQPATVQAVTGQVSHLLALADELAAPSPG
ncbi:ADP-ribosyl-[dinitrogen reductase] hydrolase [Ideonella sp. 4Y11]|uniref:ADP-ribosyl-[dinitrogen reductase] hydrolase n=2 Tax=Ideonella TaxID=36862 RepID=A0A941BMR5_9BURK|nr:MULTISPECIES: ADP-ribosyl-[dinitrogen reductase] hydrolase [Ideonella]MBQ0933043.1 ADP-ribosyl-[dinitrogen reductase] hydrolase [Ideonella alba]MBQ0961139.1 ADP-ribosyl-[dinitrogen reductase] hydrolase [Ideonella aquatica]